MHLSLTKFLSELCEILNLGLFVLFCLDLLPVSLTLLLAEKFLGYSGRMYESVFYSYVSRSSYCQNEYQYVTARTGERNVVVATVIPK